MAQWIENMTAVACPLWRHGFNPSMMQWVKGSCIAIAVAQIQALAWDLLCHGCAKKSISK